VISRRLIMAAVMLVLTSGYLHLVAAGDRVLPPARLNSLPLRIDEWRGRDLPRLDRQTEAILQADAYTLRTYTRGSAPVVLFVAYYETQRTGRTIHSPLNCLPGTGWIWADRGRVGLSADNGARMEINRNVARKNGEADLVYYWYQSRGRVIANDYMHKAALVRDALTLHRTDGALVRVTSVVGADAAASMTEAESFIRTVYPVLAEHLPE
jgi:EpsI family protein